MSKPMLVTLPCVLLLIDLWPLGRLRFPLFGAKQSAQEMAGSGAAPAPALTAPRLLIEKLPFFAMAAASSVVTYIAQQKGGAVESLEILPLQSRLVNALVTYPRYIFKTFWPADLTVMYPYEKNWPPALIIGSLLFLALVSGFVVLHVKHQAYLTTGWFWFLGTLVPTIGLVQVGSQSMADRYTYVPGIGLFIMLAWGWHELLFSFAQRHRIFAVTAAAALVGCLVCTRAQLRYWHDSEQLFRHAIAVTTNNYIAYNGLGGALDDLGRKDAALACYLEAVRLDPRYPEARHNLGTALLEKGRWDEAISHLTACVEMNPRFVQARNNLGKALLNAGRLDQARDQLFKTIELKPDYAEARYNLGTLLLMESKLSEAVAQFYQVLRLQPDNEQAHGNLAVALMRQGSVNEGIRHFSEVLRLNPTNLEARFNLGIALLEQSQWDRAAQHFSEALRRKPADARYHYYLAFALTRAGKGSDAVAHYRQALHAQPDFPDALNGLASILSSHADSKLRAGDEAVRLAQKACELTQNKRADMLTTLAAAYAETGRFNEAVATAQKARDVATAAGEKQISAKAEAVLKLAETGQPFRESF
jgi:Flp pilus assembly protein TadD